MAPRGHPWWVGRGTGVQRQGVEARVSVAGHKWVSTTQKR